MKTKVILNIVISFVVVGLFFVLLANGCGSTRKVNLALKEGGKTYLYSIMGEFIISHSLGKGESPPAFPFLMVYGRGEHYASTENLEHLVNVMGGCIHVYNKQEPAFDGYVAAADSDKSCFRKTTKNQSGQKIGEYVQVETVVLKNKAGEQLRIKWTLNPTRRKYEAIENCEVKSFFMMKQAHAGKWVGNFHKVLAISMDQLADFFGVKVELDRGDRIIYIEK